MTKELLQQALDALELQPRVLTIDNNAYPHTVARDEVIHKLKQALAQQAHFEEQPDGTVIPVDPSEKAQQEQPAQETCWCDQNNIGEPGVSCGDCPTRDYKQPALSDLIELAKVYSQQYASPHHIVFSVDGLRHLIEAHLKGQK